MESLHVFLITILSLTNIHQLVKSESVNGTMSNFSDNFSTSISYINTTTIPYVENKTNLTSTTTTSYSNTTATLTNDTGLNTSDTAIKINETTPVTTTTIPSTLNTITSDESTTSKLNKDQSKKSWPKSRWWLIASLIVTAIVLISIILIYYQRRRRPYRRFLQNWQARDDDLDNILHIEGPDVTSSQWTHRITLA